MEIWKDIDGYDGKYQISNTGRVRSFTRWKNGKDLKAGINTHGYYIVNLVKDGRKNIEFKLVHRLVALHFIPNPNELPEVNHIDGNKLNNNIDNLEWVSRFDNIRHAYKHGLIPKRRGKDNCLSKRIIQKDKKGNIIKVWDSMADINRELGYADNGISCCCNKKPHYKTAYGFIWEFEEK
jgi:hypothetical protein